MILNIEFRFKKKIQIGIYFYLENVFTLFNSETLSLDHAMQSLD